MSPDGIQEELVMKPICYTCDAVVDVWGDHITNAWQLNGRNHYEYICPECQTKQAFSIEIENESTDESMGLHLMSYVAGQFTFNKSGKTT